MKEWKIKIKRERKKERKKVRKEERKRERERERFEKHKSEVWNFEYNIRSLKVGVICMNKCIKESIDTWLNK